MQDLIKRIEAASGPDRELDAAIMVAREPNSLRLPKEGDIDEYADPARSGDVITTRGFAGAVVSAPNYTASLDAAIRLIPADWAWHVSKVDVPDAASSATVWIPSQRTKMLRNERADCHNAATPALALCAAALKARQQENSHG